MAQFSLLKGSHATGSMIELLCMKYLWTEFLKYRKLGCRIHTQAHMHTHAHWCCMCMDAQSQSCRELAYLGLTFFNNIFYFILAHKVIEICLLCFDLSFILQPCRQAHITCRVKHNFLMWQYSWQFHAYLFLQTSSRHTLKPLFLSLT